MLRPRTARVIAALAAMLLAAASAGASLAPRTAAATRCCKTEKRCGHESPRTIAPCCCAPGEAPATGTSLPEVKAPAAAWTMPVTAAMDTDVRAPALERQEAHAPPHCPLFLQRCTLVL